MNRYIVTKFGCDSGYNDMLPPEVVIFKNREEAYQYYKNVKDEIIKMKFDYDIDYMLHCVNNKKYIIQKGIDDNGAKRPIGIMIENRSI